MIGTGRISKIDVKGSKSIGITLEKYRERLKLNFGTSLHWLGVFIKY